MTKQPVCVLGITMENAGSQPSCFSLEDCKGVEYNAETGRCNLRCPGMMMTLLIIGLKGWNLKGVDRREYQKKYELGNLFGQLVAIDAPDLTENLFRTLASANIP